MTTAEVHPAPVLTKPVSTPAPLPSPTPNKVQSTGTPPAKSAAKYDAWAYAGVILMTCGAIMLTWMVLAGSDLGAKLYARHPALPAVVVLGAGAIGALMGLYNGRDVRGTRKQLSLVIGDLKWDRNNFCRGWCLTGTTGSGKTEFIKMMMHLLCKTEKGEKGPDGKYLKGLEPWAGLCIDEKGFFQEEVLPILDTYGRIEDVIVLQTRPEDSENPEKPDAEWKPKFCFNLLGDERVSTSQYVDSILRTAETIAKGNSDKGFFKTQAGLHIGAAIDLYRAIRAAQIKKGWDKSKLVAPTLRNVYGILTHQPDYNALLEKVGLRREDKKIVSTPDPNVQGGVRKEEKILWVYDYTVLDSPQIRKGIDHFQQRYWGVKAQEQLEGVKGTIVNYLHWFTDDDVCEVFCREHGTFRIDVMDLGKILCLSMPQRLAIPRRYICALMKLLAYAHGKSRNPLKFKYNLLIVWQDEAQRFIQEADKDTEIMRQYQMTTVISSQSKTSVIEAFDRKETAEVVLLNLRNRVILRAADEQCAESSATFIGKALRVKKTRTVSAQGTSYNYSEEITYIYEPYQIRSLPDFVAIIMHTKGMRRVYESAPMDNQGKVPSWFADVCSSKMRSKLPMIANGYASRFVQTVVPKPRINN